MYGEDGAGSDPKKSKGGEPAKPAWVPKSIHGLPVRVFPFVLDSWQRMQVHAAVFEVLLEVNSSSRRFAIYLLCLSYCAHSHPSRYADPADSRRRKRGKPAPKHFDEAHADQVQDAIDLAIERGCDDASHALAHIALSYLLTKGWRASVGKPQRAPTRTTPAEGERS